MLSDRTAEDVTNLIAKLDEARATLVELKTAMISPGPKAIKLNYDKAEKFAGHLIGWASRAKTKHRNIQLNLKKAGSSSHESRE